MKNNFNFILLCLFMLIIIYEYNNDNDLIQGKNILFYLFIPNFYININTWLYFKFSYF